MAREKQKLYPKLKVEEFSDKDMEPDTLPLPGDSTNSTCLGTPLAERTSRMRSVVWEYFLKEKNVNKIDKGNSEDQQRIRAQCCLCLASFVAYNTSNLIKHLRTRHKKETARVLEDKVNGPPLSLSVDSDSTGLCDFLFSFA